MQIRKVNFVEIYQNNVERSNLLLEYQNFCSIIRYFQSSNIILMAQQNYFRICIQQNFKSLGKIVLFVYYMENTVLLKLPKNLTSYRSENNLVWIIKIIMQDAHWFLER